MPDSLRPLPATFAATRGALHRLAVYVMSTAREAVDGRIRLRPTPGGFGFGPVGDDALGVFVAGTHLIIERGEEASAEPIGSLASAARLLGVAPDLSKQERFDVPPHGDLDAPLDVDDTAAEALAAWFDAALDALERLHAELGADDEIVLWPEHFDVAFTHGDEQAGTRVTFGASPGDAHHPEPYAYVLPLTKPTPGGFWNAVGFAGAETGYTEIAHCTHAGEAICAFFREGHRLVAKGA